MTNRRNSFCETPGKSTWIKSLPQLDRPVRPHQDVEVTSLKIVQDYEQDCDPYNRTGRFLLEGIKKSR